MIQNIDKQLLGDESQYKLSQGYWLDQYMGHNYWVSLNYKAPQDTVNSKLFL